MLTSPGACLGRRQREGPLDNRAPTRRYLQPEFGCLRCKGRRCFVCISCVVDALPGQYLRRMPGTNPFVAAVFRTKRLRRERCSATCQRRRRPGQARRRQGRLQITAETYANAARCCVRGGVPDWSFCRADDPAPDDPLRVWRATSGSADHVTCAGSGLLGGTRLGGLGGGSSRRITGF